MDNSKAEHGAFGPPVRLLRAHWEVRTVELSVAQDLVRRLHYSGGGSNTATYRHGLFRKGQTECLGVAWWIPPTKTAANATWPANWQGVLALTRLAIDPQVPKNGASFLLGKSMAAIDRKRWPCLVTYADEMRGHTGAIYRATNWEYCGMTAKEATFFRDGRMIARKAGPKTRTRDEMLAMGCEMVGRFAKHKFRHVVTPSCRPCGVDNRSHLSYNHHLNRPSGQKGNNMALKMKKVGPSARAKDAPLRQDLRLQFAPALELLVIGEEGIQVALPDGVEPTRLRSLLNAVSNRAGYTVSTELVWKTDKKGAYVMGEDGKRIPVAVNVYKTGTKEEVGDAAEVDENGQEVDLEVEEEEAPAPRKKAKDVVVPPVEDDDENFDPLGGDDEDDD